jgi:hypothetical protein
VWRVLYGVVARLRRAHPEYLIVRYEDLLCPETRLPSWRRIFAYFGLRFDGFAARRIQNGTATLCVLDRVCFCLTLTVNRWLQLCIEHFSRGYFNFVNTLRPHEMYHIRNRVSDVFYEFYDDQVTSPSQSTTHTCAHTVVTQDWPSVAIPPGETPRLIAPEQRTIALGHTSVPCTLRAHEAEMSKPPAPEASKKK